MILRRGAFGPLFVFTLLKVQEITSNEYHWEYYGGTSEYGGYYRKYVLACTNLTAETYAQCPIDERRCYNNDCNTLDIRNSLIFSVNTTMLPCDLYELTFSNDHIHIIAQDTFNDHSKLRKLILEHNEITSIDFLESLINLQLLNLAYNKLDHINREVLRSLENLKELYLNDNLLRSIDEKAFGNLRNLRHLQLNNNKLQSVIANMFTGLNSLQILYLQDNLIQSIQSDAFLSLTNLFHIDLTGSSLDTLENNTFNGLHSLGSLNLTKRDITIIHPGAFNSMNGLRTLDLSENMIESLRGLTFNGLSNLQYLYLQNNTLKLIAPEAFLHLNNLMWIDLSGSDLNTLESNAFVGLHSLESLNLVNLKITVIQPETFNSMGELMTLDLTCNKISDLYPESFAGLTKLQKLILNNNLIKDLPLGTFKNFPNLNNLQLGNNYLSQFKTGSFSNLGQLEHLNLSHNSFSTLNETVLYPLKNLQLLDLNNNNFTYINYTSLLLHLPNLHFISINDNSWACQMLTHMLKTFRGRGVDYLFNATKRYTEENVDGIYCTDNTMNEQKNLPRYNNYGSLNKTDGISYQSQVSTKELTILLNTLKGTLESLPINIAKHIENLEANKINAKEETVNHNSSKYITLEQFYQLIGNETKITSSDPNSANFNNKFISSLYIISILILFACTILCILFVFTVYKNYFQRKTAQNVNSRSEIELLNALS